MRFVGRWGSCWTGSEGMDEGVGGGRAGGQLGASSLWGLGILFFLLPVLFLPRCWTLFLSQLTVHMKSGRTDSNTISSTAASVSTGKRVMIDAPPPPSLLRAHASASPVVSGSGRPRTADAGIPIAPTSPTSSGSSLSLPPLQTQTLTTGTCTLRKTHPRSVA